MDADLKGLLFIKKGIREANPRGGLKKKITFKPSEGFVLLRARIEAASTSDSGRALPANFEVFFKKTKSSTQSQFVALTGSNMVDCLKARWGKITQNDLSKWAESNASPAEGMEFEFFVYRPPPRRSASASIRRATAGAIRREMERLDQYAQSNNLQIGPIQRQHLAVHNARQPEGTPIRVPNDATTRQAAALDEAREVLDAEDADAARERESQTRTINIVMNGTRVPVEVEISSLRRALGLPQHDIFHEGIFRRYRHPRLPEDANMEDVDHVADNGNLAAHADDNSSDSSSST